MGVNIEVFESFICNAMVDILLKVIQIFLAVSLVNKLSSITHKTITPKNFSTLFRVRFFCLFQLFFVFVYNPCHVYIFVILCL